MKKLLTSYVGTAGHLYWLITKNKHPKINKSMNNKQQEKIDKVMDFMAGGWKEELNNDGSLVKNYPDRDDLTPEQELRLETMEENTDFDLEEEKDEEDKKYKDDL